MNSPLEPTPIYYNSLYLSFSFLTFIKFSFSATDNTRSGIDAIAFEIACKKNPLKYVKRSYKTEMIVTLLSRRRLSGSPPINPAIYLIIYYHIRLLLIVHHSFHFAISPTIWFTISCPHTSKIA